MTRISRRDFLKLGSLVSGAIAISQFAPQVFAAPTGSGAHLPNILVLVFDAMSAENLSLYGYRRKNTPNLERFAKRATVYNQHYTPGNFTVPGTASLLTGLYPWTHRAFNSWGLIAHKFTGDNHFRVLGQQYYRLAFSQNTFPNYFFGQFVHDIDRILSPASWALIDQVVAQNFGKDRVDSYRAFNDLLFQDLTPPGSLVFGLGENMQLYEKVAHSQTDEYPNGLPYTENYPIFFKLKDIFDGVIKTIDGLPSPSIAYLHLWSPHAPYIPTREFYKIYDDGWAPRPKPDHVLGPHVATKHLNNRRASYDEYIANLDNEFGRLLDLLEAKGIFQHSYVVVTSDHGDFFERGVQDHDTPLLYDPVVRVPLLISAPGQTARQDLWIPTNSVDVLPTLVHVAGGSPPEWCEGQVLPGFGGSEDAERSMFMMQNATNPAYLPLTRGSFGLRKGPYKLTCYRGFPQYDKQDAFELYNLQDDPEEVNDLYAVKTDIAKDLRAELLARIDLENAKLKA